MVKPSKLHFFRTRTCIYFSKIYFFLIIAIILPGKLLASPQDRCPNNVRVFCESLVPQQVTTRGLNNAIGRAKAYFHNKTDQVYIIILPTGRYNIFPDPQQPVGTGQGLIRTNNFPHDTRNKLVIRGQGKYQTHLIFPVENTSISGNNASRIQWEHLHFTKNKLKTTQGQVIRKATDHLIVRLEAGFPTLRPIEAGGIVDYSKDHGRKIRKYVNPPGGEPSYQRINPNIPGGPLWKRANKVVPGDNNDRRWKIYLSDQADVQSFQVDDLVGIKSKHGEQAYKFLNSSLITFDNVLWTHETRGIFKGSNYITVKNSEAGPDPWIDDRLGRSGVQQYMASSSGGPQIGSPPDNPLNWRLLQTNPQHKGAETVSAKHGGSNHLVENNVFTRLGDDPIGLFNVEKNVVVRNNRITDGPARGILNFNVCNFFNHVAPDDLGQTNTLINSTVKRMHIYPDALLRYWSEAEKQPWCNSWWQRIWQ